MSLNLAEIDLYKQSHIKKLLLAYDKPIKKSLGQTLSHSSTIHSQYHSTFKRI